MKKILRGVVLDKSTLGKSEMPLGLQNLVEWKCYENTTKAELSERLKEVDVVLTNKVNLGQKELENTSVKYIGVLATGTNNIDLNYCKSNGIEVKNAVGYSTDSVAQHTFSMLLSFMHNTSYFDNYVKESKYMTSPSFTHLGFEFAELKNKKWGIIGLGAIGNKVAQIANVFGAEVVYYSSSDEDRSTIYNRLSLAKIAEQCDIISIHAPLNDKTNQLINADFFKLLKKKPILINVGRGGIVVEDDLIEALNKGLLLGACLDVFENEPFDYQVKYKSLQNPSKILFSPHIAWASIEARNKLWEMTENNLQVWINK